MKEIFEFRMPEEAAAAHLPSDCGRVLDGRVRVVEVERQSPLFKKIGQLDFRLRHRGKFFLSWHVRREYDASEIEAAEAFTLLPKVFNQYGEAWGTSYDEAEACGFCGAGAKRSSLLLKRNRLPKRADLAFTIGSEAIASRKVVELVATHKLRGAEFRPVYHRTRGRSVRPVPEWFEMQVIASPVDVTAATQFGVGPFDPDVDGAYRCPLGHTYGLNIVSEVFLDCASLPGDIVATAGLIGDRRGVLRPFPILCISPRFRKVMLDNGCKGFTTEIAHLA